MNPKPVVIMRRRAAPWPALGADLRPAVPRSPMRAALASSMPRLAVPSAGVHPDGGCPDGFHVILGPEVCARLRTEGRASMATGRERGGWLLGGRLVPGPGVVVVRLIGGPDDAGGSSRYTFHADALSALLDAEEHVRHESEVPLARVGWFHTHPGYGVFLSAEDVDVHTHHFPGPATLAVVLAPEPDPDGDCFGVYTSDGRGALRPCARVSRPHPAGGAAAGSRIDLPRLVSGPPPCRPSSS